MIDPKTDRVLISGAAGVIGSALRAGLRQHWRHLRLTDLKPVHDLAPNEEMVVADVSDRPALEAMMRGVKALVHLTGLGGGGTLEDLCRVNARGLFDMFEAARQLLTAFAGLPELRTTDAAACSAFLAGLGITAGQNDGGGRAANVHVAQHGDENPRRFLAQHFLRLWNILIYRAAVLVRDAQAPSIQFHHMQRSHGLNRPSAEQGELPGAFLWILNDKQKFAQAVRCIGVADQ